MTEWIEHTGSDEQIAEMFNCRNGFICKNDDVESGVLIIKYGQLFSEEQEQPILDAMYKDSINKFLNKYKTTHYLTIPDDPLREMKIRQARTGQPVWVKMGSSTYWVIAMRGFDLIYQDHVVSVIKSTSPDWNIPGAEYSFEPFKEEL